MQCGDALCGLSEVYDLGNFLRCQRKGGYGRGIAIAFVSGKFSDIIQYSQLHGMLRAGSVSVSLRCKRLTSSTDVASCEEPCSIMAYLCSEETIATANACVLVHKIIQGTFPRNLAPCLTRGQMILYWP